MTTPTERYFRPFLRDRLFLLLFIITVVTFITAIIIRDPNIERSSIPFNLVMLFFFVNLLFAVLTIRREPLLAYMFLTETILLNGTLFFFFRYLHIFQVG